MAYDFLGLVNDVNEKMNEVPLTSANFANAGGFYKDVKNSVNWALDKISKEPFNWPFQNTVVNLVLTPDQIRYDYPVDAKSVDYSTFRILGSDTLNTHTRPLWQKDYEDFLQTSGDMEARPERYHSVPTVVFRTKGLQFGVVPPPDKAYTLTYEYTKLLPRLELWDDVPNLPERFRYVVYEGALQKAFDFRGDLEAASLQAQLFKEAISSMRAVYVNRFEYVRSSQRIL